MQNQGRLVEKEPWRVNRQAQEGKQPARSKQEEPWRVNRQAQEGKQPARSKQLEPWRVNRQAQEKKSEKSGGNVWWYQDFFVPL